MKPRCFTLRLPNDLYMLVAETAHRNNTTLNTTVIELIKLAQARQLDAREIVEQLLDKEFGCRADAA